MGDRSHRRGRDGVAKDASRNFSGPVDGTALSSEFLSRIGLGFSASGFFGSVSFGALLLGVVLMGAVGCSDLPYYWQAGAGQLEILNQRRPIHEVLDDSSVGTEIKRKLRLIVSVQDFATEELALSSEGHYRHYTDLGRPYVSWLVVASQPLALREHQFCYLIVGCLGYRGFFDPTDAEELAEELRAIDLDVLVRPVRAYSTLGWFDDPVLNTFLKGEDVDLIATVIHEQTHRRFFLKGDTAFNESFASFVEHEGVRGYLSKHSQSSGDVTLERFQTLRADRRRFRRLLKQTRDRLESLYASNGTTEAKRTIKARLIEDMRRDFRSEKDSFKILKYERWFKQPLNNAHFVGLGHYTLYVRAFEALFAESGRNFAEFYASVEALADLPPEERNARLLALENKLVAHESR